MTCKCPSDMHHAINCPEYKLPAHLTDRRAARAAHGLGLGGGEVIHDGPETEGRDETDAIRRANPGTARPGEPSVNPLDVAPTTIPPHLQRRIDEIKAKAVEAGMAPDRFDDMLNTTAHRVHEAFRASQEPLTAEIGSTEPRRPFLGLVLLCGAFITGAAVGRWLTR